MLLSLCALALAQPVPATPAWPASACASVDEFDDRLAAAGRDLAALMELAAWCDENDMRSQRNQVYELVIEIEPDHEEARSGLRHHRYDGQWFTSYSELSRYKREESERMRAQGLVKFEERWVPEADVPFLRMGWQKGANDRWMRPSEVAAAAERALYEADGWQQQDLTWIHPDEFDRWRAGEFKVGEEWLSAEDANAHHSQIGQWWTVPGQHFVGYCTTERNTTDWAVWHADRVFPDLVRLFGQQPERKPAFAVLSGLEQYNRFANGDQEAGLRPAEVDGFSSVHYAFFAEAWIEAVGEQAEYMGGGACFWDTGDEVLSTYGPLAVRHAAAHSYVEAIDPSWNTVSGAMTGEGQMDTGAFWGEKRIPRWLRYGAAAYVERFKQDREVAEGGDPWGLRNWARANLRERGERTGFDALFAFELDAGDSAASEKLILDAGLVVAFLLDGGHGPLRQAHARFKAALRSGEDLEGALENLHDTLRGSESELDAWAAE